MTWTNAQKRSVSVTMVSLGVMSGICACWRSVSVAVASSGVLFPPVGVHSFWVAQLCPYRADTLFHWGVTVVVSSMAMPELPQNSSISSNFQSPRLASLLACAAGITAGVDDVSAMPFNRLDWRRCLPVLQELQQALMTYQPCRPGCEEIRH